MNGANKKVLVGAVAVLVLTTLIGVGLGRWHLARKQTPKPAGMETVSVSQPKAVSIPQFGSLLPEGRQVELQGHAVCAYCFWNEGTTCHTALKLDTEPGAVFLLPNAKLAELDKLTSACADGSIEVRVRGSITRYNDRNYLLLTEFERLARP